MKKLIVLTIAILGFLQLSAQEHKNVFFNMHDMEARYIEKTYGVPYHISMAVSALETGWGTSKLYREKNNPFGLRNADGTYKKFDSVLEGWIYFGKLVSSAKRYAPLKHCTNYRDYAITLAKCGYNTERPEWAGEVIRIILANKKKLKIES